MKIKYLLLLFGLIPYTTYAQTSSLDISKGLTVKQVNEALSSKIDISKIDSPNGVAGTNDLNQITLPNVSGGNLIGSWRDNVPNMDWYGKGYESDMFGGVTGWSENSELGGIPKSIILTSDPYGPYSPGCAMQITMGSPNHWYQQFPISQGMPASGAQGVVSVGGYDTVASCILTGNTPARLILNVTSYTATTAVLDHNLTSDEAKAIKRNMYLTTNSIDSTISKNSDTTVLPTKRLYAAYVAEPPKAGDDHINVYAWAVPGYGKWDADQIPLTTALDTDFSAYDHPVIFLGGGAGDHTFSGNWFQSINFEDLWPTKNTKSLVHTFTPLEIDLSMYSPTGAHSAPPDHSVKYGGITFNAGNYPSALTVDSFEMMFGGNINNHIIFDGAPGNWDIVGNGIYMPVISAGISPGNKYQLSQAWEQWVHGSNKVQTVLWNGLENTNVTPGWQESVTHFGVTVDGNLTTTGNPYGSKQGDIEWNQGSNFGSVSLCGYSMYCGLRVEGNGNTTIEKDLWIKSGGSVGNGKSLIFFPPSAGVPSAKLTGGGASALNLTDTAGGNGWLNLGGFDATQNSFLENGSKLFLKPDANHQTGQQGVQSAIAACGFDTLCATSNFSASVVFATPVLMTWNGGSDQYSSAIHTFMSSDKSGNFWTYTNNDNSGGGLALKGYTLANLPKDTVTDGTQLWCKDCKLNGETGLLVVWHTASSKWTDIMNGTLSN